MAVPLLGGLYDGHDRCRASRHVPPAGLARLEQDLPRETSPSRICVRRRWGARNVPFLGRPHDHATRAQQIKGRAPVRWCGRKDLLLTRQSRVSGLPQFRFARIAESARMPGTRYTGGTSNSRRIIGCLLATRSMRQITCLRAWVGPPLAVTMQSWIGVSVRTSDACVARHRAGRRQSSLKGRLFNGHGINRTRTGPTLVASVQGNAKEIRSELDAREEICRGIRSRDDSSPYRDYSAAWQVVGDVPDAHATGG